MVRSAALNALPTAMRTMNKQGIQAEYAAMQPSKFRRRRPGVSSLGSGADYHFGDESAFIQMREYIRAMDRDDAFIGRLADCAMEQTVQTGYSFDPDTGDTALDTDIYARWTDWANDPDQCDISGEHSYGDMSYLVGRQELLDGDIFGAVTEDGPIEIFEADRCRTPSYLRTKNIVYGVELDSNRKRQNFYFTKETISGSNQRLAMNKFAPLAVRDEHGNRQVTQLYDPTRVTQTRGITAFHAIFDISGMFEDVNFALLIKQQMAACVGAFLENPAATTGTMGNDDLKVGEQTTQISPNGTSVDTVESWTPGLFLRGKPGQKLQSYSPQVPSSETMAHLRFLLQVIGINIGLPLAMVLLDPKDSGSFSAWRGIFDQAKLGFQFNQERHISRFHRPNWKGKIRHFMADDPAMRSAATRDGIRIFNVKIKGPRWRYIQPLDDAKSKSHKVFNLLSSLRRENSDDGNDFDDVYKETVDDNFDSISYAIQRKKDLVTKFGDEAKDVSWRDLLPRDLPSGLKMPPAADAQTGDGSDATKTKSNAA